MASRTRLKVIPLGGSGEIGKNMLVLECRDDIVVVDCGLMFPEEEMLGVDLVIPDISYLLEKQEKVRGIVITHGHEDHTGALPYVLPRLKVPVFSTRLTNGLISVKLKEHKALQGAELNMVQPGEAITLGRLKVEFIRVSHSIPDAVALAIHTPVGTVVHSGDFKLDHTPVDGKLTDFAKFAQLGTQGVLLLLADSTYVEEPGYTPSERVVGEALNRIVAEAPGRVIVATFASLISRVQQVIDAAAKDGRHVFILGRSMVDNVKMALDMGYLMAPPGILGKVDELRHMAPEKVAVVTTGTQGEPTSVLVRMANRDHPQLHVMAGDTIIISASPIPGNESLINRTIDSLFKQGARVVYSRLAQVHVHGHGSQEELKLLMNLVRPKYLVPIHGEYRHLVLHKALGESLGIPPDNIFVVEDGDVLELDQKRGRVTGRVPASYVYVDGLTVGDVGRVVLRDRRALARDGVLVVIVAIDKRTGKVIGRPDIVSRGFIEIREGGELMEGARELVVKALDRGTDHLAEWGFIHSKVKDTLARFLHDRTGLRPMILPVAMEV